MTEYLDTEAVLSEEEEDLDYRKKKKSNKIMIDSDEEEEDDEAEDMQQELDDLIDDAPIEESDDSDNDEESTGKGRKRRRKSSGNNDDRLEDDDYELLQENLGIKVDNMRYKRLKVIQNEGSDEDSEHEISNEREAIANELFEGGASDDDARSERSQRQEPATNEIGSDEESSDADDFIVDDEGRPINKKREKKKSIYADPALQTAQDIFGIDFDYNEFEKYGDEGDDDNDDEGDGDDDDERQRRRRRSETVKSTKKTIFEIYEPSELKRGHMTDVDNEIRNCDLPERMQTRSLPVTPVPEGSNELDLEAEWIYQQAFNFPTISTQNMRPNVDQEYAEKGPQIVAKLKKVLDLMRNRNLEVPFISFYRKELVRPDLNINDLWKVYKFDAKWCQLRQRKENLLKLFEKMRNFQLDEIMKNPDEPVSDSIRIIKEDDIDRLKAVQTNEEFNDVYSHFKLHYSHNIPAVQEMMRKEREVELLEKREKRRKQLIEAEENGEDPPPELENEDEEVNVYEDTIKQAVRSGPYLLCKKAGLDTFAKKFGLTPEQFAENLRDNYQRHEVDQDPIEPSIVAEDYIGPKFGSSEEVLDAVKLMVAIELAREPLVRKCVREMYFEKAKLTVRPTKNGIKEIDENHSIFTMKYLKDKPVRELSDDQYLKLSMAEADKLINITFCDNIDGNTTSDYIEEVKQFYIRDEFSKNVQDWNNLRMASVEMALKKMIIPDLQKELKARLLSESKEYVLHACCAKVFDWLKVGPYTCEFPDQEDEEWDTSDGIRVMAISYVPDQQNQSAFACIVAPNGMFTSHIKLPHLLKRKNSKREGEAELKEADLLSIRNFISANKPHVIVISGKSREALTISTDIKECLMTLSSEEKYPMIEVEILDNDLSKVYANSNIGITEFRDFPEVLREAVSLARRLQDPLVEFSQLCTPDEEILCLKYHTLQSQLPKEELLENLYLEFVNRVNEVGVDINKAIKQQNCGNLLQFVCGLGPRKSQGLIKLLRRTIQKLENRTQLITACHMGPKIFINCAGFIKIDTNNIGDAYEDDIELLDGSRVHPETYEWAKKMAIDALEIEDPIEAMRNILETPDRLKELDLDAFADELERQGCGNKRITLQDIRSELSSPYKDLRILFQSVTPEDLFDILTKETSETFYIGKLVLATVVNFNYRKPERDQLDQANPVRNEETGLWQCPFCLKNDFSEMSDVWNHFDVDTCPGKANGVRLRLENGLSGYIHIKNISDSRVENPESRVYVGQVINCRVTKIEVDRFSVECSSKSSDLADENNEWRPTKDSCYDTEAEEEDNRLEEAARNVQRQTYVKRLTFHPLFHNINYAETEKMMRPMKQGEVVIRPSSKGSDHLTVTWKVTDDICQHIDVREEGKENIFSLGRKLWIGDEEFEDLDEIVARHVNVMASFALDLLEYKKYKKGIDGVKCLADKLLREMKKASPKEIPYFISASKEYPGRFALSYLPRTSGKHEYISVTSNGLRYRNQMFTRVDDLIRWFKEHFREPIPNKNTPVSNSRTPYSTTPGSLSNMDSEVIARVAQNLPNDVINSLSKATGQTPHYNQTPQYKQTPVYNNVNTPYTPSDRTPFLAAPTPQFTPCDPQATPQYGQKTPGEFLHPSVLTNRNTYLREKTDSNQSNSVKNTNNNQFDWSNSTGTDTSSISVKNENNSFDWQTDTTDSSNQDGNGRSPFSRRPNPYNNVRGGRSNWRAPNGRQNRQNMRRNSTPYSRPNQRNDENNDSFDWGSGANGQSTTNADDNSFDWGTSGESTNQNETSSNNAAGDSFDWGTSGDSTSQNGTSDNNTTGNGSNWRGGSSQRRPRRNHYNNNNSNSSRQFNSNNNANNDSFDWGTSGDSTNQNETSGNDAAGDSFDWGTSGDSTSQNGTSDNNTTRNGSNWRGGSSQRRPRRNHYNNNNSNSSRQFNSNNNADNDSFDWGTSGDSTNQNETSGNDAAGDSFDWGTSGDSTSQNGTSDNNTTRNGSNWRGGSSQRRPRRNHYNNNNSNSSRQFNSNNNADNNSFDWGTSGDSTNQNETSGNNAAGDSFDWGTSGDSTNQNETSDNNTTGNGSNWRGGSSQRRPRRNHYNNNNSNSSRQYNSNNNADNNSFDWGTTGDSTNQNETSDNNTSENGSNWRGGSAQRRPRRNHYNNNNSNTSRQFNSNNNNAGDNSFDWGTSGESTSQSETPTNNTAENSSDWGQNSFKQPRRNYNNNNSNSSRQFNSSNNAANDNNTFDWGTVTESQSADQNANQESTASSGQTNDTDNAFDWGTSGDSTNQNETPTNDTTSNSSDWGSSTVTQSSYNNSYEKSTSYSNRYNSNNSRGNRSNWRAPNGRQNRQDMRRNSTPYSRPQNQRNNNRDNDSFDWKRLGGGRNNTNRRSSSSFGSAPTNDTNDDMFDWGTSAASQPTSNQTTSANNTNDTFDWGTSATTQSSSNETNSTNNGRNNPFDWNRLGGGRNNANRRSSSSSFGSNAKNNADDNSFDWGTVTTESSSNQANDTNNNTSDWGTGGATRQNKYQRSGQESNRSFSRNNDVDSFDWGTGAAAQSNQNNYRKSAASTNQSYSSNNNPDDNSFDWGTGTAAEETNQSETPSNNADASFDEQADVKPSVINNKNVKLSPITTEWNNGDATPLYDEN